MASNTAAKQLLEIAKNRLNKFFRGDHLSDTHCPTQAFFKRWRTMQQNILALDTMSTRKTRRGRIRQVA